MPSIHLTTFIKAPADRVFDLARNLTLYKKLLQQRKELLSSGSASHLPSTGDTVTVHAKHLGKTRSVILRVMEMDKPRLYVEEQVKGDLGSFRHERHFMVADNGTFLIDKLEVEPPRDLLGRLIGKYYIKRYVEKLVQQRNDLIRQYAESEKWRAVS